MSVTKWILPLLFLAACSPCNAQQTSWLTSFDQATKLAKRNGVPVMIYFTTEWCGWCRIMERDTFSDAQVAKSSKAYVGVKLDAEKEGKVLSQKYKVSAYPSFVFVTPDGREMGRIVGYCEPKPFVNKVKTIIEGTVNRKQIEAALKRNPKSGPTLIQMGNLLLLDGKLKEAQSLADRAVSVGYKGSDLAALLSQTGQEIGLSNPVEATRLLNQSLVLRDQSTISLTYERLMNLAAIGGNRALMIETGKRIMAAQSVSPDLVRRAERVVKGGEQDDKLTSAADLIKELQAQLQAKPELDRDSFFFRNLFLDGAALTVVLNMNGQYGRMLVDMDSFIQNLGIDKLKTKWTFEPGKVELDGPMASGSFEYKSESQNAKGENLVSHGTMMFIACQQGSRWYIQSLCMRAKPAKIALF